MAEGPVRVVVVSHSWEALAQGGAERSAAALVAGLNQRDDVQATLVACVPGEQMHGNAPLGVDAASGAILIASQTDGEFLSWRAPEMVRAWVELLQALRPDVLHLHHYAHAGVELPAVARRVLPDVRVVVTLHEFMAMCPRWGQMVDRDGLLCEAPSTRKCGTCMGWSPEYTVARTEYVRSGLAAVDWFTSPSHFLAERYAAWGIDHRRLRVLPNVVSTPVARRRVGEVDKDRLRVGYLGQHTPFKGLGVLLDAYAMLPPHVQDSLVLEVFGSGAERFGPEFAESLAEHPARSMPGVSFRGRYENARVADILDDLDALVVPSTWWENSPVVIEEALARGVPVICSDIGGMAEKVRDGIDGWHVRAGSASALARRFEGLVEDPAAFASVRPRTPAPVPEAVAAYVGLYREAIAAPA